MAIECQEGQKDAKPSQLALQVYHKYSATCTYNETNETRKFDRYTCILLYLDWP